MGPKKDNAVGLELEEIRKSLDFMSGELSTVAQQQATVAKQQTMLLSLMDDVKQLHTLIKEKDAKIDALETRIEKLEQYTRMENVIVTGLDPKHRSYASVTRAGDAEEDAPAAEQETLEQQVINFFATKKINIQNENISTCHMLPRKDRNTKPAVIIRFANRKHKVELMKQYGKLKGTGVFMNEHLTKTTATIAWKARQLKKHGKIKGTWTRNCKVMIRLNGETPEEAKVITIQDLADLDKY